jgi:hypothetical protein
MYQCLVTTLAAFEDPTTGIKARMGELMALPDVPSVRNEWTFGKWGIPRTALEDTRTNRCTVRPYVARDQASVPATGLRHGTQRIEVVVSAFGAEPETIQDILAIGQWAALRVIERLPDYSRPPGEPARGTIYEVAPPDAPTVDSEFEVITATYAAVTLSFVALERSNQ